MIPRQNPVELPHYDVVWQTHLSSGATLITSRAWKVAPALAVGCTIVMKPSEITPLTALVRHSVTSRQQTLV